MIGYDVEKENVRLVYGDSREVLKHFPDCYFDAIITDPPYGVGFDDYDKSADVFFSLEDEFYRVLKPGGWFVFWWSTKKLLEASKIRRFAYRWMLVAEFRKTVSRSIVGDRAYAPIFVFSKGDAKVKMRLSEILPATELPQIEGMKIRQGDFKPTYTQALLLSIFAGKEGKVLDPFAGFGSLLLASLLTGISQVVGIEKDTGRFEVAKRLLEEEGVHAPIPEMMSGRKMKNGELW